MSKYRAYIIGSDGEFQNSFSLECADDAVTLKKAKQMVDAHHVELWQKARLLPGLLPMGDHHAGPPAHRSIEPRSEHKDRANCFHHRPPHR